MLICKESSGKPTFVNKLKTKTIKLMGVIKKNNINQSKTGLFC